MNLLCCMNNCCYLLSCHIDGAFMPFIVIIFMFLPPVIFKPECNIRVTLVSEFVETITGPDLSKLCAGATGITVVSFFSDVGLTFDDFAPITIFDVYK